MKNFFSILILSLLVISCNDQESEGYYLTGTVNNVPDGTNVYIAQLDENAQAKPVDTTQIKDGEFNLDLPEVEHSNISFLSIEGTDGETVFISENETINFDVDKDSIRGTVVSGGTENELFNEYISHIKESVQKGKESTQAMQQAFLAQDTAELERISRTQAELEENQDVFKREMFEENKDHLVSAIILSDMINLKTYPNSEIVEMYDSLSENVKNSSIGKFLEKNIKKQSDVAIGGKAPNFSAPNPSGEEISLEESLGKVTIIDFWASWCKPCRIENPNVVKIYNEYHDKGLNIIGVSLDRPGQKNKWVEAIEADNLTWKHVSNLQFWQEPIAQTYGVRSIPATFILDENGTIVAKDLKGEQLEAKIAELLNDAPAN